MEPNLVMMILGTTSRQPGPCKYVPGTRKQNHQCRRDSGLPEVIREAQRLALTYCEQQFRYERWNCSIETKGKRNLFRKVSFELLYINNSLI